MAVKDRTLYVLKYLWQNTDEDHPATTSDILAALADEGLSINRHTITTDIEQLQEFGIDVIHTKGSPNKYFIGIRQLELPELKLLVDAVESSRFISAKKSKELVGKLYSMTSIHQAKELNRHLYVDGKVKSDNKVLYYTVDLLHKAINDSKRIRFKYIEYTVEKKKVYKHNGYIYEFSPYALLWHNDCYYVIGYSEKHESITKFRIDRIDRAELSEKSAVKKPTDFDINTYLKNIFSMYDGEMQNVRLKCDSDMMKVMIDRFGKSVNTTVYENGGFIADVKVSVSPTFFGWLFGFGGKIRIVDPPNIVEDYIAAARSAIDSYGDVK